MYMYTCIRDPAGRLSSQPLPRVEDVAAPNQMKEPQPKRVLQQRSRTAGLRTHMYNNGVKSSHPCTYYFYFYY